VAGFCALLLLAAAPTSARAGGADGGGAPVAAAVEGPVFSAVEEVPRVTLLGREVDALIDSVVALNERYGWRWSETGSLIAGLEEAFLDLDKGRFPKAASQLTDFADRIRGDMTDGSLPPEAGRRLLDGADAILGRIQALERATRLEAHAPPLPVSPDAP